MWSQVQLGMAFLSPFLVMPGCKLDPGIHDEHRRARPLIYRALRSIMDCRVTPGNNGK
jgi:hypothetical protein